MLFLSLVFILAGLSLAGAALVMITCLIIAAGDKPLGLLLSPRCWPPAFRRWVRLAGVGLAASLLGMVLALAAT